MSTKKEHGTTQSYVIGFLLSLVFTAIPYYLVVNKNVTGTMLLSTILGFAVLQMFIQIFFFLHLGRGPKPWYNVVFFFGTAGTILVVVLGSIFIMNNLHYNMTPDETATYLAEQEAIYQVDGEKTGACHGTGQNHQIILKAGKVTPANTAARLCDTLTFINQDDQVREIGFGSHPVHDGYAGQDDLLVRKGKNKTLTLNQTGAYSFHDHLDPSVEGNFMVSE